MELADETLSLAEHLSHPSRWGLADQLRRAAISVPANIAEGYGRRYRGDYIRFLAIANGSLRELETLLLLVQRRAMAPEEPQEKALAVADEVGRLLTALHRSLVRK